MNRERESHPCWTLHQIARQQLIGVVPEQVGRLHWDAGGLAQYRSARLIETLGFAAEHSPWHAGRLSSLDLEAVTPEDLTSLPTMTHTSAPVNLVKGYPAPLPSW
jgi:hypothetical protein